MSTSWYRIEENRANPAGVATVYLHDEIGAFGVTSKDFVADLQGIKASTIRLHLNTPGGVVDDGIAIYNALKSHPAAVEAYNDALTASIGVTIMLAADKRVAAPHSRMMIHEAMALGMGFASDFEKVAARLRDTTRNIAALYEEATGRPADEWLAMMAAETWFGDQEAVDIGLATEVGRDYEPANFRAATNFALLNSYRGRPDFGDVPGIEETNAGRTISQVNVQKLRDARDLLDAVLSSAEPEKDTAGEVETNHSETDTQASLAPEGDPEPSLTPQEEAMAALNRRLALIKL